MPLRLFIVLLLSLPLTLAALDNCDYQKEVTNFSSLPQLQPYFRHAYGYAVFPAVAKGGVGAGVAYGEGRVYRKNRFCGYSSMSQLSFGLQLGGQVFSEIIFFKDRKAFNTFISETFELDATASAVAVTLGAQATIGTTGNSAALSTSARNRQTRGRYVNGMAVFTRIQGGLMYELSIGGQRFTFTPYHRRR